MGGASEQMKSSICHFLLALFKEHSVMDDQPMLLFAEVEAIINAHLLTPVTLDIDNIEDY